MASWNELVEDIQRLQDHEKEQWIAHGLHISLSEISSHLDGRSVVMYASGFLQKQNVPSSHISITHEDINGFMGAVHGLDRTKGLTLIMHSPGGVTNATESIVSYLRQVFDSVEVIIPAFAMSAGTMISLASDKITVAKHGQLGPIDPQMPMPGGRMAPARSIVEQFNTAKSEILENPMMAHAWAPINSQLGPALLQEAENALAYSEEIVANWLATYMLAGDPDSEGKGRAIASYFNDASVHKSHGRRIGYVEAQSQGLKIDRLEDDPELQEIVLTAYHRMTICFEQTNVTKFIWSSSGNTWIKNWVGKQ